MGGIGLREQRIDTQPPPNVRHRFLGLTGKIPIRHGELIETSPLFSVTCGSLLHGMELPEEHVDGENHRGRLRRRLDGGKSTAVRLCELSGERVIQVILASQQKDSGGQDYREWLPIRVPSFQVIDRRREQLTPRPFFPSGSFGKTCSFQIRGDVAFDAALVGVFPQRRISRAPGAIAPKPRCVRGYPGDRSKSPCKKIRPGTRYSADTETRGGPPGNARAGFRGNHLWIWLNMPKVYASSLESPTPSP